MSEEAIRIYAENLMFEMKRPCMTPIDVKLITGGITKHCCWTCYNCKTARGIILEVTSSLLANLTAKVGERVGWDVVPGFGIESSTNGQLLFRKSVVEMIDTFFAKDTP